MAEFSQASIDKLNTTLDRLAGGNSIGAKPSATNLDFSQVVDKMGDVAKSAIPVVIGFQRLATGAEPAAIAIANLGKVAGAIGLTGFGNAIDLVGKAILENKAQVDAATRAGFATNDVLKFTREAAGAGLTVEQFSKTLQNYGANIAGLSGSGARSAEQFSQLTTALRESKDSAIPSLLAFGVTTQELNDYAALSLTNSRKLNMADEQSRRLAMTAAEEMALQLTQTALATGMNREALAQQTKAAQDSADTFLVLNTLEGKQKDAYLETQIALKPLGPAADHLQVAFQTGKFDDTARGMYSALNAINGSADKLQSAQIRLQKAYESGDAAQIESAKQEQARAVALAQAAINSKQYAEVALTSNSNLAKVSREIVSDVAVQRSARQARANAEEAGGSYEAGADKARLEARATILGKQVDANGRPIDAQGKVITDTKSLQGAAEDPGQALSRGVNEFDNRIKTQASALATNFEDLNKEALKAPGAAKALTDSIASVAGPLTNTATKAAENQKAMEDVIKEIKKILPTPGENKSSSTVPDYNPTAKQRVTKERTSGTLGETGSPIEPADAIVKIHKGETVLDPDAVKNIRKSLNFSEISKTIDTTISSSGGGSTTTSRVQNEDSKKAEAELEKVRGQYESDRQKLLSQTKAQLGPDASFKDIIKAMTTGDSAKALEEKYKSLMDPLQKRMDDGTSIEVSRKEGVIEKTRQQVEEHTKILSTELDRKKTAASQSASIQSDAEKVKMAGYEREANLAKEVIGKNVAGLSDDAITAMLPKGAKMDDFYIDMNNKLQSFSADYVNKIQENEKAKQAVVTTYSNEQVDVVKTTEQLKKVVSSEQIAGKVEEAKAQMSKVLQTLDVKQLAGPVPIGSVTEQKKQMEDMFTKIGGGSLMGDMFNPKIIDTKQAEINKAKFAEEDKAKNEKQAREKQAEAEKQQASKQQSPVPPPAASQPATLNDLNEQLKILNSMMLRVISNTANTATHVEKTAKNTKLGR